MDQLRSELMQERSARHDLEMDKSAVERQVHAHTRAQRCTSVSCKTCSVFFKHSLASQVKELRSRVADMEGQTRPSTGISVLENKIQELEERLRSEERYDA